MRPERPAGDPLGSRRAVVQLHLGRGSHQHQRYGPPPRQRLGDGEPTPCEATSLSASANWSGEACVDLARMIPDDGEGATHLITIDVEGCRDREAGPHDCAGRRRQSAREDGDPRGRPELGPDRLGGRLCRRPVRGVRALALAQRRALYRDGTPLRFRRRGRLDADLRAERDVHVRLVFQLGTASVRFWTCDLTAEYVRSNADYTNVKGACGVRQVLADAPARRVSSRGLAILTSRSVLRSPPPAAAGRRASC